MNANKIWANFRVEDANRTHQFYTHLGFKAAKFSNDPKLASFLFGKDEFVIHFFEQNSQINEYLTSDSKNGSEIIFTLSAQTEQEVKEWENKVKDGGRNYFSRCGKGQSRILWFRIF